MNLKINIIEKKNIYLCEGLLTTQGKIVRVMRNDRLVEMCDTSIVGMDDVIPIELDLIDEDGKHIECNKEQQYLLLVKYLDEGLRYIQDDSVLFAERKPKLPEPPEKTYEVNISRQHREMLIKILNMYETLMGICDEKGMSEIISEEKFDCLLLKSILKYDVNVILTEKQVKDYTSDNGVNLSNFQFKEIISK